MTQPNLPDGPLVPLMVEGLIDADTLRQLFADLVRATTVHAVQEKCGPAAYARAETLTSDDALTRLLAGVARAVQVRYQFAEHEWTDTILAAPNGFCVVRCRHEPAV